MCFMERTINAIGQGAFYTEQFYNGINVVYDCGSETNLMLLKKTIDNRFKHISQINLVFISHFHNDHINGLPYLLLNYNVKNVVIPYLNQNEIIIHLFELAIYCHLNNNINLVEENILAYIIESAGDNPSERVRNLDFDIRITTVGEEQSEKQEIEIDNISTKITSGSSIIINEGQWNYIPYNYKQDIYYVLLEAAINKLLGKMPSTYEEIKSIIENKYTREEIIKAYKLVFGSSGLNNSSMAVFSGQKCDQFLEIKRLGVHDEFWYYIKKAGCLYTGDINISDSAKWGELKANYRKVWKNIQVMQLPHHGSKNNFFKNIAKEEFEFFLCAGKKNKYAHPDFEVVREILFNGRLLNIISEDINTQLVYYIE